MNERGYIGEFFLWLLGRELPYPKPPKPMEPVSVRGGYVFATYRTSLWVCALTGDYYAFSMHMPTAPNVIHRAMQRFVLGIKYKRMEGS
jgi:hypothetical protein